MKIKRLTAIATACAAALLMFASCSPSISVRVKNLDDVQVDFSAGFSKQTKDAILELLQSASGLVSSEHTDFEGTSIFSEEEIKDFLSGAGATSVSAKTDNGKEISASGTIKSLSTNPLADTGILTRTANSLTLTLGPKQFTSLYSKLSEESQGYLDLLMIPALNDDAMTTAEYRGLLSSVYGKELANEVCDGVLSIELKSPDSKKSLSEKIPLGELLTLTESKSWSVSW